MCDCGVCSTCRSDAAFQKQWKDISTNYMARFSADQLRHLGDFTNDIRQNMEASNSSQLAIKALTDITNILHHLAREKS